MQFGQLCRNSFTQSTKMSKKYFSIKKHNFFLKLLHWTRRRQLWSSAKTFALEIWKNSHNFSKWQSLFFKKFRWTRRRHLWQAFRKSFCEKSHYFIAQCPEKIMKMWIVQKKHFSSIWSSGHNELSYGKLAENVSQKVSQGFCSISEHWENRIF